MIYIYMSKKDDGMSEIYLKYGPVMIPLITLNFINIDSNKELKSYP